MTNVADAQEAGSRATFGGIGLLEMRNARFAADGEISVGAGIIDSDRNYYANWQATPWFETTLRYTDLGQDSTDKALDVKIRVVEEGDIRPALAIGLQDLLGNGIASGEYIVASKNISNFDVTAGFGFGNLSHRARIGNIFRIFGDSFKERGIYDPASENIRFDDYFSGEKMGFFWGVEYNTPVNGLTAKVEYSTYNKSNLNSFVDYNSKTAFNFGLNYKVNDWLEFGSGLLHGNQLAFNLTLKQNLNKPMKLGFADGLAPDEIRVRELRNSPSSSLDFKTNNDQDIIFERMDRLGYIINRLEVNQGHLILSLNDNSKVPDEMLYGALLEQYRRVTVHINDSGRTINRSDDDGQNALKAFKNSDIFMREISNAQGLSTSIKDGLTSRKLSPLSIQFNDDEITLVKDTGPYLEMPKNIARAGRYLTASTPDNVERFNIITQDDGIELSKVSVLRKDIEKLAGYNGSPEEVLANAAITKPKPLNDTVSGSFDYGIFPEVISHFGSTKDDHFKADVNIRAYLNYNVTRGLKLYAEGKQHIIGDLDLIPASSSNNVPHVRSDIARYSAEGKTSLRRLGAEYTVNPYKDIFARITAGHLEEMYSGVSGELLYSPYNSSVSFGFDVNYVKQRNFDQLFSMLDYETVTGHANIYYINKQYDITAKISAGRYLAKDWGTTLDVSREFDNGITVGAFATVTDMSEQDFGEGSFDKGIYIVIPFDFFWFKQSREKSRYNFRRLGKNGGQKLDRYNPLFNTVSQGQEYKIRRDWNSFVE